MMNGVAVMVFTFLISTLSPSLVFAECMACHQGGAVESDKAGTQSDDVASTVSDDLND